MKIGLIGNMNNNFFSLVRYLRDQKFDAHLYLFNNETIHFHPSSDTFNSDYQEYTHQLTWGSGKSFFHSTKRNIIADISDLDFIIGCGATPAFLSKIGRKLDIFAPYGSDIYVLPVFLKNIKTFNPFLSIYQRNGIENSRYVLMDETNPNFESFITRLKFKGKRIKSAIPFIYHPVFNPDSIKSFYNQCHWYNEFMTIRENNDIVVFHHSSHFWKTPPIDCWQGETKGNDKVIKGFARFVTQNKDINASLILFEYGPDVAESKKLINQLNISKNVIWFPVLSRKEIFAGISLADIGIGEVGLSYLSYGTIYEFICMGKPVMYRRDDELYSERYPELFPMINVTNADQISVALNNYIQNPAKHQKMGMVSREWFLKYAINQPLNKITKIINGDLKN